LTLANGTVVLLFVIRMTRGFTGEYLVVAKWPSTLQARFAFREPQKNVLFACPRGFPATSDADLPACVLFNV